MRELAAIAGTAEGEGPPMAPPAGRPSAPVPTGRLHIRSFMLPSARHIRQS